MCPTVNSDGFWEGGEPWGAALASARRETELDICEPQERLHTPKAGALDRWPVEWDSSSHSVLADSLQGE